MSKNKHLYVTLCIIFILAILIFGLTRATNEYRWSGWGPGDAHSLSAATHFSEEGFIENYFLTYFHPGYMGAVNPSSAQYNWWWDGYYTHSPSLYAVINGVILELGGNRYAAQAFSIFLSCIALFLWYIFAAYFFNRRVALISTAVTGLSVVFLEHFDGLARQTYDVFFVFGAMALFTAIEHGGLWAERKRLRRLAFATVWALVLLQSLNSPEYIMFLPPFFLGYYFLKKATRVSYKKILLFISAPVVGLSLHFLQIAWLFGSFTAAWADVWGLITHRVTGTAMTARLGAGGTEGFQPLGELRLMDAQFAAGLGVGLFALFLLIIMLRFVETYESPRHFIKIRREFSPTNIVIWLTICMLPWRIVFFEGPEIYHPAHALPTLSLMLALLIYFYFSTAVRAFRSIFKRWLSKPYDLASKFLTGTAKFGTATIIVLIPIFFFTSNSISYLCEYPNAISNERTWLTFSPLEKVKEGTEIAQKIKGETAYGDIIFHNLGNEWVFGAETFPLYEWYSGRRCLVLGRSLQRVKKVPISDGSLDEAYNQLQPKALPYDENGMLMIEDGGLPDDGFIYTYVTSEIENGRQVDYLVGVKNFKYRLAKLKEYRRNLIDEGKVEDDQIRYLALVDEAMEALPLQKYLLQNYRWEEITPGYKLIHLDEPSSFLYSLEAYWPMDDVIGEKTYDISGFNRNLFFDGNYRLLSEGKSGPAIEFGAARNGMVTSTENKYSGIYLEGEMTLAFWLNPHDDASNLRFITLRKTGEEKDISIGAEALQPHKLKVQIGEVECYSRSDINPDTWTHVAVIFNQATRTIKIYVNGSPDMVYEGAEFTLTDQFIDYVKLGGVYQQPNNHNFSLDEIIVFSKELGPEEINLVHGNNLSKDEIAPSSLEKLAGSGISTATPEWVKGSNMNVFPNEEVFSPWQIGGRFYVKSVSQGVLTVKTVGTGHGHFNRGDERLNNETGTTVEFKMKLLQASSHGFQGAFFALQDGTHEAKITFYPDSISVRDQNIEKAAYAMNTSNDFHVYRLTMVKDSLRVYVDYNLVATITLEKAVPHKGIIFGDLSTEEGENIHAEFDYIIYDVAGAFFPLGKPAGNDDIAELVRWNSTSDTNLLLNTESPYSWIRTGIFDATVKPDSGLSMSTTGNNVGYFVRFDNQLDNGKGSTADIKLKLINPPMIFSLQDGTYEGKLVFYPNRIYIQDSVEEIAVYYIDTQDDFHIYRLALKNDILNVYVDGSHIESVYMIENIQTKAVLFGDTSIEDGENMNAQIKYISYTTDGALAPDGQPAIALPITGSAQEIATVPFVTKFSDMRTPPNEERISPWSKHGNFEVAEVSNSKLKLKTTGSNTGLFSHGEGQFDNEVGVTVEVKMKLISASSHGFQGACISVQDGLREAKVTFYPDHISVRDQNAEKATYPMNTMDYFHVYRLAMIRDKLNVYVDGELAASIILENVVKERVVIIGDLSQEDEENIDAVIDYIAYTASGAYDINGQTIGGDN